MISFYTAGKTWHAEKFRNLRELGMPVRARWIDLAADSHIVLYQKDVLWQQCLEDVRDSTFVLMFCGEQDEEQRGALVEVGMAFSLGKHVYCIGNCRSLTADNGSDVAFTHHPLFTRLNTSDLWEGTRLALGYELCKMKSFNKRTA